MAGSGAECGRYGGKGISNLSYVYLSIRDVFFMDPGLNYIPFDYQLVRCNTTHYAISIVFYIE